MTETVAGASVWERTLLEMLESHAHEEAEVEGEYRALVEHVEAADVQFLIKLILEDEERHHRWFGQLASSVTALTTGDRQPDIPWLGKLEARDELREATKRFLKVERADAKGLRHLMKELQDVEETTMWALLVKIMLLDTQKHVEILRFIEQRTRH